VGCRQRKSCRPHTVEQSQGRSLAAGNSTPIALQRGYRCIARLGARVAEEVAHAGRR
jgi:hypothetical protein